MTSPSSRTPLFPKSDRQQKSYSHRPASVTWMSSRAVTCRLVFCILYVYCAPAPPHRVPCSTITLLHPTSSQRMTTSETDRTALANWNVRRRQATTPLGLAVAPKSPPQTWVLLLAGWLPSFAYPQAAALCGLPPIRGESSQVRYWSHRSLPQPHSENGRNWPRNC